MSNKSYRSKTGRSTKRPLGQGGLDADDAIFSGLDVVEVMQKFGRYDSVGTTFVPVAIGGIYRTLQAAGATALRVKAGGNANDTAAGTGAREITLVGLDENFAAVTETLATAGASASLATTATFTRLYRAWVSKSGTYASATAGSHSGDIVIEDSGGTQDWGTISSTSFPRGQTEIGAYTIPAGKTGYVPYATVSVDSTKSSDLLFFQRTGAGAAAVPYDAMRVVFELGGVSNDRTIKPRYPYGPFVGPCDLGFMAKVASGTAAVVVDFEVWLVDA